MKYVDPLGSALMSSVSAVFLWLILSFKIQGKPEEEPLRHTGTVGPQGLQCGP